MSLNSDLNETNQVSANDAVKPIGVFDSGLGGLTVVRSLRRQLPSESILYFGDTARVPYGSKSTSTIRRFTEELTLFLQRQGVKMVIVACNTCSATALDCVAVHFDGLVLGVIEPGVQAALEASVTRRVGIIGTKATIASHAYQQALIAADPDVKVFATACPLLVPLAEEHMQDHPATRLIIRDYLAPLLDQTIDTLILGCTHYPLLKATIEDVVGPDVKVVDSAECTAQATAGALQKVGLNAPGHSQPSLRYYVSDDPNGLEQFYRRLCPADPIWVGMARPEQQ